MSSIDIEIHEEPVLQRVRLLRQRMPEIIADELDAYANDVAEGMRQLISSPAVSKPGQPPGRRTGALQGSITVEGAGMVARVGPTVNYGVYLEHGTRKMAARPFVEVSALSMMDEFADRIWRRIESIL